MTIIALLVFSVLFYQFLIKPAFLLETGGTQQRRSNYQQANEQLLEAWRQMQAYQERQRQEAFRRHQEQAQQQTEIIIEDIEDVTTPKRTQWFKSKFGARSNKAAQGGEYIDYEEL